MVEYVGLDVSKEETAYCVKAAGGAVLARGQVASEAKAILAALAEPCLCPRRIVMETGTLSAWLAEGLSELGLAVDAIDARRANPEGPCGDEASAQQDGRQ